MKRSTFNLPRALRTLEEEALAVTEEGTLRQRFVEALSRFLEAAGLTKEGVVLRVDERQHSQTIVRNVT